MEQEMPTEWLFNTGEQPVADDELVNVIFDDGYVCEVMGNQDFPAGGFDWTIIKTECATYGNIWGWRPANPPEGFFDGKEIFTTG